MSKWIIFAVVILVSFAWTDEINTESSVIWVGKSGDKENILRGISSKEQLFPDFVPNSYTIGNSIRSRLYKINSEKEVSSKLKMSMDTFIDLGFGTTLSTSSKKKSSLYIYELSLAREIHEFGLGPENLKEIKSRPEIAKMTRTEFIEEYGQELVSRQEINSYAYLFMEVDETEKISEVEMKNTFKLFFLEFTTPLPGGKAKATQKKLMSRVQFIIDGVDYKNMSEREVIQKLAKKDFSDLTFTTPRRSNLTFIDFPSLFGKNPNYLDAITKIAFGKYKIGWKGGKASGIYSVTKLEIQRDGTIYLYYAHQKGYLKIHYIKGREIHGTWHQYYAYLGIGKNITGKIYLKFNKDFSAAEGWWEDYNNPKRETLYLSAD